MAFFPQLSWKDLVLSEMNARMPTGWLETFRSLNKLWGGRTFLSSSVFRYCAFLAARLIEVEVDGRPGLSEILVRQVRRPAICPYAKSGHSEGHWSWPFQLQVSVT